MKVSSLAAPKVVILTTFGAASDEDFIKMKTFSFQCTCTVHTKLTKGCSNRIHPAYISSTHFICWVHPHITDVNISFNGNDKSQYERKVDNKNSGGRNRKVNVINNTFYSIRYGKNVHIYWCSISFSEIKYACLKQNFAKSWWQMLYLA